MAEVDERFIDPETRGLNYDALDVFRMKFAKLYEDLKTMIPKTLEHPGIMRANMISRFNIVECNLDLSAQDDTGLNKIAYMPKETKAFEMVQAYTTISVAEEMLYLPWNEVFGLDIDQVKTLSYHEWYTLATYLRNNKKDDPIGKLTSTIESLVQSLAGIGGQPPTKGK